MTRCISANPVRRPRAVSTPNPARRLHDDVARTLRAIPIAAGIEVVLTAIRHAIVTIGEAIDHMPRAILRAGSPTSAVTVRTSRPVVVVGPIAGLPMLIVVAVLRTLIAVVTLTRFLGLAHGVGARLDRQAVGR